MQFENSDVLKLLMFLKPGEKSVRSRPISKKAKSILT